MHFKSVNYFYHKKLYLIVQYEFLNNYFIQMAP